MKKVNLTKFFSLFFGVFFCVFLYQINITEAVDIILSNVTADNITSNSANIRWTTDKVSSSKVWYDTVSGQYGYDSVNRCDAGGDVTVHCVILTGLQASTIYYYRAYSVIASTSESGIVLGQFTTTSGTAATSTVPSVPSGLSVSVSASGVDTVLSWTDNSANEDRFEIYRRPSGGAWLLVTTTSSNVTSYTNTGLSAGTYDYHVNACNSSGCSSDSNIATVTIAPPSDTIVPSIPSDVSTTVVSSSQINLSWTASTDNVGVTSYKIFRNSSFVTSVTVLSYTDVGLSPGTTYQYYVKSYDAAGNESAAGATVSGDTAAAGSTDTTAPSVPTGLTATAVSSSQINISWTASTDSVGVTGYRIYRGGTQVATASSTSYSDTGLTAATAYSYTVAAYDAAGNLSSQSLSVTVTTLSSTTTVSPSQPTQLNWSKVKIANGYGSQAVRAGDEYGIVWSTKDRSGETEIYFTRMSSSGAKIGSDLLVSTGHITADSYFAITWNGTEYAVVYEDYWGNVPLHSNSYSSYTTYFARISSQGQKVGTDVIVATGGQMAYPHLFWTGSDYTLIYSQNNGNALHFLKLQSNGQPNGSPKVLLSGGGFNYFSAVWTGSEYGLAWNYFNYGKNAYFGRVSASGTLLQSTLLPQTQTQTNFPLIVWTGSEYGVFYTETGTSYATYLVRFNSSGAQQGSRVQVSTYGKGITAAGAWNGTNYLIFWLGSLTATPQYLGYGRWWLGEINNQGALVSTESWLTDTENSWWTYIPLNNSFVYRSSQTAIFYHVNGEIYFAANAGITAVSPPPSSPSGDTTPPAISLLRAENIINSSAQIKWTTDDLSDSRVYWGTASTSLSNFSNASCNGSGNVTAHCVSLSGLALSTVYYYKAYSKNSAGLDTASSVLSFTSAATTATTTTTATTATTTTTTTATPPPYTPTLYGFQVDAANTFSQNGVTNVPTDAKIHVKFTKEIDLSSTKEQFFVLAESATPDSPISGSFQISGDSFEFTPSFAAKPGTTYIYKVFTALKDKDGANLVSAFSASFTTAGAQLAGATIEGVVNDAAGKAVAGAGIHIFSEDFSVNFGGVSGNDGTFRISVSAGNYLVEALPPSGRKDLLRKTPLKISVASGETKKADIKFVSAVKIITGATAFSDGTVINDAEVGAYSSDRGQWVSAFVDSAGKYTLNVGGGRWQVGIRPKDPLTAKWSFAGIYAEVSFSSDEVVEARIINIEIPVALDAKLVVKAVDEDGKALVDVGIVVDTFSAKSSFTGARTHPDFRKTNSTGTAAFNLRSAIFYYIRAFLPSESGFLNPSEESVALAGGETKEVKLVFKKPNVITSAKVRGVTKINDGTAVDAFIWAWSEKGRFVDTRSQSSGEFNMSLALGDRWHIGAGREVGSIPYKAAEITIDVTNEILDLEIILTRIGALPLPPTVSVSQAATRSVVAQTNDGAKMSLPGGAAASSGSVSVEIKPTVEAPSQAATRVVSTVYDVTIKDAAGKELTVLSEEAEIILPYSKADLKAQGVNEDNIIPSFLDETTGVWVKIDNFTIDKEKNVIVARIKHLTRFAIVAAADVIAPSAPAGLNAIALGGGKIKITWKNPTSDFDHSKVYRSEEKGKLGIIVSSETAVEEFIDADITDGVLYYYTVRAVDPAGNESSNTNQASVRAVGTSAKAKPKPVVLPLGQATKAAILRELLSGSSGDDVKDLQELLVKEGVYPESLITGFFGALTKQAVIRFQEKYFEDILKPAGLLKGTGVVGPATRKKVNELLGAAPSVEKPALPPGQAIKSEILKTLIQGTSGDDVKILQELLVKEGVYPEGLITGFFGILTKQAVILFQEKYRDEILVPAGLDQGSGFVGQMSLKKINQLLAK